MKLTLEKIKACIAVEGDLGETLKSIVEVWYAKEIADGKNEQEALDSTLDRLGQRILQMSNETETKARQ